MSKISRILFYISVELLLTLSIFSPIHKIIQLNARLINVDIKCEKVKANVTNPFVVICGKSEGNSLKSASKVGHWMCGGSFVL